MFFLTAENDCGITTSCDSILFDCQKPNPNIWDSIPSKTAYFRAFSYPSTLGNTYRWDFGDGNTSTDQNPVHTYESTGSYTVCLVIENTCDIDSTCKEVIVENCKKPIADFGLYSYGKANYFSDASRSFSNNPNYLWDFGDGNNSNIPNPYHKFEAPGTYNVCMIVSTQCGSDTICKDITIECLSPTANFGWSADGKSIQLSNGSSSDTTMQYVWDFGDGNTSTEKNPSHKYDQQGNYKVQLITTNGCGSDTINRSVLISCTVPDIFIHTMDATYLSRHDILIDTANSNATNYYWDYGDGNTSTNPHKFHTYDETGEYDVMVIASNSCGADTAYKTHIIQCPLPIVNFFDSVAENTVFFRNWSNYMQHEPRTFLWEFGDGNTSTDPNPIYTYAATGTYNVCFTVYNECGEVKKCKNVEISTITNTTKITKHNFSVYPNPVTDQISIAFENSNSGLMEIMTLGGQIVQSEWFNESSSLNYAVDLSPGIYVLRITSDGQQHQQKLIVR